MSEMIERVADALTAQMVKDQDETSAFYGDDKDGKYMKRLARAALAAMRKPTEAMIGVGDKASARLDKRYESGNGEEVWQAMIDAALGEP